jgi:hypothetical protein
VLAGRGGEDVLDLERLKRLGARERRVVMIAPEREARAPFIALQGAERDGVRVDFGTWVGGARAGYRARPMVSRMPEDREACRLDYEGRRWT